MFHHLDGHDAWLQKAFVPAIMLSIVCVCAMGCERNNSHQVIMWITSLYINMVLLYVIL